MGDGAAYGVSGTLFADARGDFTVGHGFAVGNREQDVPDLFAKRRGLRCERRQKVRLSAAEVKIEPTASLLEYGEALLLVLIIERGGEMLLLVEPKPDERHTVAGKRDGAERRGVVCGVLHGGFVLSL